MPGVTRRTPLEHDPAGELPDAEVLRRRLRIALRNARNAAKLTQRATADKLDWSASKIVRIEQGTVPVAPSDVRVMLALFGVTDKARVEGLVAIARDARDAKSWDAYDDILSPSFKELIGQEAAASSIWKYEPSLVPGYLQTGNYSRALLSVLGHAAEDVARRAEIREKRQRILDLQDGPELHIVIGEIALVRPVGGADVMREQIKHLIELSKQPTVDLHLLPFAAGAHRGMGEPFTVLQFDDPDLDDSLYLEDAKKKTTSRDDPTEVESHLELFNVIEELADRHGSFEDQAKRLFAQHYGVAT